MVFSPVPNVAYPTSTGNPEQIHQPAVPTIITVQSYSTIVANLEKTSVQTHCRKCNNEIFTRVINNYLLNGICLMIICCLCGSWILGLCVLRMDGFKEYCHFCPACNVLIGKYRPKVSGGSLCLFIFFSILIIALEMYMIMIYLGFFDNDLIRLVY